MCGLCGLWRDPMGLPWLLLFSESESLLPPSVCVFACLARWSDRINFLLHVGHANLFSPVCVRKCRWSSSDLVNLFPQNNQLQTKGRSPVCHLKWALRWDVFPYTFPHPGIWQLWMFFLRRCWPAGPRRSASWQFGQSQTALPVYLLCVRGVIGAEDWPRLNWVAAAVCPKSEAVCDPNKPLPAAAKPNADAAL